MPNNTHRYLAALPRGEGKVFLSWRLLAADAPDAAFHLERQAPGGNWQRVTDQPIVDSTNYLDTTPRPGLHTYRVVGPDGMACETASATALPDSARYAGNWLRVSKDQ